MKRRNFIHLLGAGTMLPVMMNGFKVTAFAEQTPFLNLLANVACEDRILVLIQMAGGNDGLNTVIPLDQYGLYKAARPNIAVAEASALKLTDATGLNPNLKELQTLHTNGKLRVIQSVGYPTPDFSHFRSTDIWLTASDSDTIIDTGWLGRWLDTQYPGFPIGYPNSAMPHPVAIQIGNTVSTGLESKTANMGMAFSSLTSYSNIVNYGDGTATNTRFLHELDYVRETGLQVKNFADPVIKLASKVTNKVTYPGANANPLAEQLKIVAQMIAGGLKTRVYIVTQTGYDTHSSQNTAGTGTPFAHPTLLQQLSQAIGLFQSDIQQLGVADKVTGMTFSEFGRRIKQNGSNGTDHGAAAPMFVFGNNVVNGVLGNNPTIPSTVTLEDNVPMQFDFRSVYASLLRDWFCVPQTDIKNLLFKDFATLPIIKGGSTSDVNEQCSTITTSAVRCSPNPASDNVVVTFTADGSPCKLSLFDHTGREVSVLVESTIAAGDHEVRFDASALSSGNYYWRLQTLRIQQTSPMIVVR